MSKLIVSKFGGTSMGDALCMKKSAAVVKSQGSKLVVVSATSGTTNKLIELAQKAESGDWNACEKIFFDIKEKHHTIAKELSVNEDTLTQVNAILDEAETLAKGIHLMRECSLRAMDRMQSFGERLSSWLFTKALQDSLGTPVVCFDVRDIMATDNDYGRATPQIDTIRQNALKTWPKLTTEDTVYVTQGFIGKDHLGHTTTLGRGGSDYSASLLGEAVRADIVEIWTDVAGIATTDPRLHSGARAIETITFQEAAEMAVFGAKVLHPTTLTPAMRHNIPVYVGSTFEPEKKGTWIHRETDQLPLFRAIALKKDQCLVTLSTPKMLNAYGFLAQIFDVFQKHKVSVDSVTTSEISVAMTVDRPVLKNQAFFDELNQLGDVKFEEGFSLVSLIGNHINHTAGLAVKIFGQLEDINVRMICLGASKHNFCALVSEKDGPEVVKRLHRALIEN